MDGCMLQSMTGFGKSNGVFASKKISVEIRSLNSKGLDLSLKIPSVYRELETDIRKIISEELDRGKIDIGIYIESQSVSSEIKINTELAHAYHQELKKLNASWGEKEVDFMSVIMRMPEVVSQNQDEITEEEIKFVLSLVIQAVHQVVSFRNQEGLALHNEFVKRISEINKGIHGIEKYEGDRIQTVRDRITKNLEELTIGEIDQNRFEQELIFYIEKLDISEEKMRLNNHLNFFLENLKMPKTGKKLGFITQEIGREINTLGSKSNHSEMQKIVVEMKDSLEKIKEQVLNTL